MSSELISQESLFWNAGHSFASSIFLIKAHCSRHIIKPFSALDNKISIDSIFEEFLETVHMLI